MRGVIIHAPHDLRIEEISAVAPAAQEVRVKIESGGICGSDLHYYHDGGFGTVRIKQPMALGHEIAGVIEEVGAGVSHLAPGMRVAVNPSRPCNHCRFCLEGQQRYCLDMQFMGSAMRFPHAQGGFRQSVTVDAGQAVPIAPTLTMAEAAMAEPLAVCLHAAARAGSLMGKRVLVTGSGPIGVITLAVARYAGASEVVVTDVAPFPLSLAKTMGATRTVNVAEERDGLAAYTADNGHFDVMFECSGNQAALVGAFDAIRPGGIIVQVGIGGEMTLPISVIVAKEIELRGTFRFDREFALAVDLMGKGLIDLKPLVTATLPFDRATEAFNLASDRSQSMKVQLAF